MTGDPTPAAVPAASAPATAPPRETTAIRRNRRMWDRRAHNWGTDGAAGLGAVVQAVLRESTVSPGDVVVDLGCGTGQLTLPLARQGAQVTAVDVSSEMIARLRDKAASEGVAVAASLVQPIEHLSFAPGSVDLVVSNYALHHLRDADKAAAVAAVATWLRPGGRFVVGDMMFGRGASTGDREIIAGKVRTLVRRGPAGWYRLAKNVVRYMARYDDRPVPVDTWLGYLRAAGFSDVRGERVVAEAAVVTGVKA